MLDFLKVMTSKKGETTTIWPDFLVQKSKDLMIKGRKFYAIWDEEEGLWSTDEYRARVLIDREIEKVYLDTKTRFPDEIIKPLYLKNASSKKYREWQVYVTSIPDSFHSLDQTITFSNTEVKKEDYISRRLSYPLVKEDTPCYDEIISTLYSPTEREKLEWAIGSIIAGDSKKIQKFIVLYGEKGSGKSTILKIYQKVLEGYWETFKSTNLGNAQAQFALEAFQNNPLMAIDHEGKLDRIEDNTRLNAIVSHEHTEINVKNKNIFSMAINSFLFICTNNPVKITDAKSGILRRLIDVSPTGKTISTHKYYDLFEKAKTFELGGIAYRCLKVYKELGRTYYDNYSPTSMMAITNEFFNFMEEADNYFYFKEHGDTEEGVTLDVAWNRYNMYVENARVPYPFSKRVFKEELKTYFKSFENCRRGNGVYRGLREEKFDFNWSGKKKEEREKEDSKEQYKGWIVWDGKGASEFDKAFADIQAQYCWVDDNGSEKPKAAWDLVKTFLKDVDPSTVHYCRPPGFIIIIDLDLKDEEGNKSLELNLKAANMFPPTYAEVSKGGNGIHLVYIYDGEVSDLADIFDKDIEIKKFVGKESLRRKLSMYNSLPIAHISSGLPLKKGVKSTVTSTQFESENKLRNTIKKCLRKEVHKYTTSNINMIKHITDEAYASGEPYDVRDLRSAIQTFAAGSSNQKVYCSKVASDIHYCSKNFEEQDTISSSYDDYYTDDPVSKIENELWSECPIAIFDWEVFKNLSLVCYKIYDPPESTEKHPVESLINPTPEQIAALHANYRIVGFNNLNYDNFMSNGRILGYDNMQLYNLSKKIVNGSKEDKKSIGMYSSKKLSYTDIFDFSKVKKGLKWFEVELEMADHYELGFDWDKPVPEEMWDKVVEYCKNDVLATEALWNSKDLQDDWLARQMLAVISGLTVNDTNNTHSARIMFGNNKHPQNEFVYPDLSLEFPGYEFSQYGIDISRYIKGADGKPIYTTGKSIFMGEDPSEGGYAWGRPGMYGNVKAYDVTSMHPSTMIALNLFGPRYTAVLKELVDLRKALKHKDRAAAEKAFGGKLIPYLIDDAAYIGAANALKIVINSIYGLTSAPFPNIFKDERNIDNVVAKRGALFMIQLKHKVQDMGYTVVHCKTDCIKVADADERLDKFIEEEGRKYGYEFEVEDWFDKFCVVNKAAYIGRLLNKDGSLGEWISKADEFNAPYTFKTLFSKEPIEFKDLRQNKSARTAIFMDMDEDIPQMDPALLKELKLLQAKKKAFNLLSNKNGIEYEKYLKKYKTDYAPYEEDRLLFLTDMESKTHNYIFIGKFCSVCPILPGHGGGRLVRDQDGKKVTVQGTDGYRWLEAELVKGTDLEKYIDLSYFEKEALEAREDVAQYGDFDWFVSDEPYRGVVPIPITASKGIKLQVDEILRGQMNPPEAA